MAAAAPVHAGLGAGYAGLRWPAGAASAAAVGPYRAAILHAAAGHNPALLSLAYAVDSAPRHDAVRALSLQQGAQDLSSVSSCHPTATRLVEDFGTGATTSVGRFGRHVTPMAARPDASRPAASSLAADLAAIRGNTLPPQAIRYSHHDHSVALLAHTGGVEPVESWAGGAETEAEARARDTAVAHPLHASLMAPRPVVPLDAAIAHAQALGSAKKADRKKALAAFSAAGIAGFEPSGAKLSALYTSYDRRDLRPAAAVGAIAGQRVATATRDLSEAPAALARMQEENARAQRQLDRHRSRGARGGGRAGRGRRGGRASGGAAGTSSSASSSTGSANSSTSTASTTSTTSTASSGSPTAAPEAAATSVAAAPRRSRRRQRPAESPPARRVRARLVGPSAADAALAELDTSASTTTTTTAVSSSTAEDPPPASSGRGERGRGGGRGRDRRRRGGR